MSTARSARSTTAAVLLLGALALGGWATIGDGPSLSVLSLPENAGESRTFGFEDAPPYDRSEFGDGWASAGPGCDVRDVILARDLDEVTLADGCDVLAGRLTDPYTGIIVVGSTRGLDVDHVVPLAHAWSLGAWRWTPDEREAFANDPENLLATAASVNRAKSDSALGEWLPAVGQCGYAQRFDQVADRYGLDDPERDGQVAAACR